MIINVSEPFYYGNDEEIWMFTDPWEDAMEKRFTHQPEQVERVQFHFKSIPVTMNTVIYDGDMVLIPVRKLFPDGFNRHTKRFITMIIDFPMRLAYTAFHRGGSIDWPIELDANDPQDVAFEKALWERINEILDEIDRRAAEKNARCEFEHTESPMP